MPDAHVRTLRLQLSSHRRRLAECAATHRAGLGFGATRRRQRHRRKTRFSTPMNREPIRAPPG